MPSEISQSEQDITDSAYRRHLAGVVRLTGQEVEWWLSVQREGRVILEAIVQNATKLSLQMVEMVNLMLCTGCGWCRQFFQYKQAACIW